MKGFSPGRPSPALVVSILALVMATAGTGYAAVKLPRSSVGTPQLKNNAVTSKKVKNRSLSAADLSRSARTALTGPAGAKGDRGPEGAKGDKGDPGEPASRLFATVKDDGALIAGTPGVAITKGGSGAYRVTFAQTVTNCAATVTPGGVPLPGGPPGTSTASQRGVARTFIETGGATSLDGTPSSRTVGVETNNSMFNPTDSSFHLIVLC